MSTGTQTEVVMPQMGVSVSEGTITKWLKQIGDSVQRDEPLLEISTDKVDTEVPSSAEGIVTQILVQEGETVEVGTVLAIIGPAGAEVAPPEPEPVLVTPEPAAAPAEPAGPIVASTVPTSTVSPSWTKICVTTPSAGLGTSVSTLSVEISSSGSSRAISSPTCLIHFVIVPSDTETPIWGITTSVCVPVDTVPPRALISGQFS